MRNLQLQTVGGGISICGDGHSDSPGFSAKYTTYNFMSDATKEIIMVDFIQVNACLGGGQLSHWWKVK